MLYKKGKGDMKETKLAKAENRHRKGKKHPWPNSLSTFTPFASCEKPYTPNTTLTHSCTHFDTIWSTNTSQEKGREREKPRPNRNQEKGRER
jgi:hypothetical protein